MRRGRQTGQSGAASQSALHRAVAKRRQIWWQRPSGENQHYRRPARGCGEEPPRVRRVTQLSATQQLASAAGLYICHHLTIIAWSLACWECLPLSGILILAQSRVICRKASSQQLNITADMSFEHVSVVVQMLPLPRSVPLSSVPDLFRTTPTGDFHRRRVATCGRPFYNCCRVWSLSLGLSRQAFEEVSTS